MSIDFKKWFDQMQPQTLQIATWLLYLDGVFSFLAVIDSTGVEGFFIGRFAFGFLLMLAVTLCYPMSGLLMANDRRLGWRLAVVAAASPFALNVLGTILADRIYDFGSTVNPYEYLTGHVFGGSSIGVLFNGALVVLLLHQQSREHQRIWFH